MGVRLSKLCWLKSGIHYWLKVLIWKIKLSPGSKNDQCNVCMLPFMLVIWCELNQTIKSCYFWPTPATKSGVTKIFGQRKCALTPMEPCKLWIRVHKITTMQNQKPTRKLFWIPNLINKGANWNAIPRQPYWFAIFEPQRDTFSDCTMMQSLVD